MDIQNIPKIKFPNVFEIQCSPCKILCASVF